MFWAEAVATEVRSVVTVMPVTRMPLTPRLKRVWRRINKAKGPRIARQRSPGAPSLNGFGDRRKYDLRMPGVRRLEPIADDVPTSPPITCDTAATASCFVQRVELAVATESRLRTILAAIVRSSAAGNRGMRPGGADLYEAGAPGWERGVLVHIGVRSICAGIAALAIGFALESVSGRVVGAASAGLRADSALFSVFETIRPKSLDHRASLVRVASLETGFAFDPAVEE